MRSQQLTPPLNRAYREAGHTVMAFLILKGFTEKYIPISRESILSEFTQVTIDGENTKWAKVTDELGSLITVPQVLLAGYLTEAIKFDLERDLTRKTGLVNSARSILSGYVDHYYTDDLRENRKETANLLIEISNFVEENLLIHWASIEIVATALLEQRTLSKEQAFELIEVTMSENLKIKAQIELSRTREEKLRELLKNIERQELNIKKTPQKKLWWQFWKK